MRIAYVCADPGVPVFGRKGCSVHVQEVVRSLLSLGAEIELFATRVDGDPPPRLEMVRLHQLPPGGQGELSARERAAFAANAGLRVALDSTAPFDLIYERYSIWSFAAMEAARDRGVPGLLEVNAPLVDEQAQSRGLEDRAGADLVAERVFGAATALLAVSEEVAAYLAGFPSTHGHIHVLANGVDPNRFELIPRAARPGKDNIVGFVGTLKPWHGLPVLVEAFSILHECRPATRLLVVGSGPEQASLEADLASRGLREAVDLTGLVDPGQVPALLASMDVAVAPYPSLDRFYFSPLKVYEYMAAGRAVVASRIGQLSGLITDGVDGLLCPPGDARALAIAIERVLGDPMLRDRLGRAARANVLRDHTWDAVARRILGLAGLEPSPRTQALQGVT